MREIDIQRAAFEAYAKNAGLDLDCRHTYDEQGNYCYDGYVWHDTAEAFRMWQAAEAAALARRAG